MAGLKNNEAMLSCTWSLTGSSRPQTITLGVSEDTARSATDIASAFQTAACGTSSAPFHQANCDASYTLTVIRCTLNRGGSITAHEITPALAGTATFNCPPPQVCLNVKKLTPYTNRRYRGRFFMPAAFIDESDITEVGTLASTPRTNIQNRLTTMYDELHGEGIIPAILHQNTTEVATAISSFVLQASVATVRHRKPRL